MCYHFFERCKGSYTHTLTGHMRRQETNSGVHLTKERTHTFNCLLQEQRICELRYLEQETLEFSDSETPTSWKATLFISFHLTLGAGWGGGGSSETFLQFPPSPEKIVCVNPLDGFRFLECSFTIKANFKTLKEYI